ncbi:MAG: hydrogen peroxide-dependent heme synthase [Corynebacterium sp.]|nr:hydrogen peroxide-dependent heme synthase [Corynebacterium sp.]
MSQSHPHQLSRVDYETLNQKHQYVQWLAFSIIPGALGEDRAAVIEDAHAFLAAVESRGITVRGIYDVSGIRAEADFLIWWHADQLTDLQRAYNDFRRSTLLGQASLTFWTGTGLHRPAEFNKSHIPSYIRGDEPKEWMTLYPFVRSYDWYLLDPSERRKILADHGAAGRKFPQVLANTTAAFALGDYEWMLCFEADDMDTLVDLMHAMRYTKAREHVREEIPFFSGPRVDIAQIIEVLP